MASSKFKILAFDPGLTTTGWSLLEGDTSSGELVILKIGEIHPGPTVDRASYRDEVEKFDKRTISLAYLREEVTKLLDEVKPDAVAAEDIYINPHRPMAYGALCMVICVLKFICRDIAGKRLITIPTKIAKMETTKYGGSGKEDVIDAIRNNKQIKFKDEYDRLHMSEHQADSIAVGIALKNRYLDYIVQELERKHAG